MSGITTTSRSTRATLFRYRRPELDRRCRLPFMPVVPAIGVIASLWLVTSPQWGTWVQKRKLSASRRDLWVILA